MIAVTDIVKKFTLKNNAVDALRHVSISIFSGEFVSIVGPSGSGKSTLLLVMGGLLTPTAGSARIDGTAIYDLPAAARAAVLREKLGFIFQTFNLVPYLSSLENVQVPLYLSGHDETEQGRKARDLLDRFGLSHRLNHKPGELSVGERQRVALARALANDPSYILADEPTGNLDGELAAEILRNFEELRAAGKTVVMVTHDRRLSENSDRVIELVDGTVHSMTVNNYVESESM